MSLGFDPTIQPVPGNTGQFDITVHPNKDEPNSGTRTFRTIQVISTFGAEPFRGRGSRVFKAIELDGNGEPVGTPVVLKDTWIDSDRMREGDILTSLRKAADDGDKKLVDKYFLTTICHGDVWTELGIVDDTTNCLMRGLKIAKDHASLFQLQRKSFFEDSSNTSGTGSKNLRAFSHAQVPRHRNIYEPKTHYRIVFKETGVTIDSMRSLPSVMKVLAETVIGASQYCTVYL